MLWLMCIFVASNVIHRYQEQARWNTQADNTRLLAELHVAHENIAQLEAQASLAKGSKLPILELAPQKDVTTEPKAGAVPEPRAKAAPRTLKDAATADSSKESASGSTPRETHEVRGIPANYIIHKNQLDWVTFDGKKIYKCPSCNYVPKQAQTAKGGWQNKMAAVVIAFENENKALIGAMCKKLT